MIFVNIKFLLVRRNYCKTITIISWINCVFSLFGTSQSAMCVVASKVLNLQPVIGDLAVNNIPTFFTSHDFANTSVCPEKQWPASDHDFLQIGPVTSAELGLFFTISIAFFK